MKTTSSTRLVFAASLLSLVLSSYSLAGDDRGINIGDLTINPYVNLEYRFDNNVRFTKTKLEDQILSVVPGFDLNYNGNEWGIQGEAFYGYDRYQKYDELTTHRWSERLRSWVNLGKLTWILGEYCNNRKGYDSILDGGNGVWRDRTQWQVFTILQYAFNDKTHMAFDLSYTGVHNKNSTNYRRLYDWQNASAGLEFGRQISEKTDILLRGQIGYYDSDGVNKVKYKSDSMCYTLQAGLGSRATKRVTYRALTGVSAINYGMEDWKYGWSYSLDLNWVISTKMALSLMGSSFFQPSEDKQNRVDLNYTLAAGWTYRPIKRFTIRGDLAWRRRVEEFSTNRDDESYDLFSARLQLDYDLMRYMTVYAGLEYDWRIDSRNDGDVYNRFMATLGLRLLY